MKEKFKGKSKQENVGNRQNDFLIVNVDLAVILGTKISISEIGTDNGESAKSKSKDNFVNAQKQIVGNNQLGGEVKISNGGKVKSQRKDQGII